MRWNALQRDPGSRFGASAASGTTTTAQSLALAMSAGRRGWCAAVDRGAAGDALAPGDWCSAPWHHGNPDGVVREGGMVPVVTGHERNHARLRTQPDGRLIPPSTPHDCCVIAALIRTIFQKSRSPPAVAVLFHNFPVRNPLWKPRRHTPLLMTAARRHSGLNPARLNMSPSKSWRFSMTSSPLC